MRFDRSCGVLLHPTSLPGPFGIGDLGPPADRYLDWLARHGVRWWQVLPLFAPGPGNSPYSGTSSFAGNVFLISPERLVEDDLLAATDLAEAPPFRSDRVDYEAAKAFKHRLLATAWLRFQSDPSPGVARRFGAFMEANQDWLDDYSLYASLKRNHDEQPWWEWPEKLALRRPEALNRWRDEHLDEIAGFQYRQFLFFDQWERLRDRAASRGIGIIGDLPIFVARDSADVWANRELFLLDARGLPEVVAGVPPDYFSEDGQLWGNPLYDWKRHAASGFAWWIARVRASLRLVDVVRLDHFRGFEAHWEVAAGEKTARRGRWVKGPGRALFDAVAEALGAAPFIAEDLGSINDEVLALRDELDLPGMAVLQFAFQPHPRSLFLPYFHHPHQVVYTGTHDNNTSLGWYRDELDAAGQDFLRRYVAADGREMHWDLIRLALASVADLAVVPHQDIAGLTSEHRMNTPGIGGGNWEFRLADGMLDDDLGRRLGEMIWLYGRTPETAKPG
jgi:4-alpha-glucanotransferase